MNSIEKTDNKNCHDDNHFDDVTEIRFSHIVGMLTLAMGRASQSYPLSEL